MPKQTPKPCAARRVDSETRMVAELSRPIIKGLGFAASLIQRKSLKRLKNDVYDFASERYFIGEIVDVYVDRERHVGKVKSVIYQPREDEERPSDIRRKARIWWPPACVYKYLVDIGGAHQNGALVPQTDVSRPKNTFSRGLVEAFLAKAFVEHDGTWNVKSSALKKYCLRKLDVSRIFCAPLPTIGDGTSPESPVREEEIYRLIQSTPRPRSSGGMTAKECKALQKRMRVPCPSLSATSNGEKPSTSPKSQESKSRTPDGGQRSRKRPRSPKTPVLASSDSKRVAGGSVAPVSIGREKRNNLIWRMNFRKTPSSVDESASSSQPERSYAGRESSADPSANTVPEKRKGTMRTKASSVVESPCRERSNELSGRITKRRHTVTTPAMSAEEGTQNSSKHPTGNGLRLRVQRGALPEQPSEPLPPKPLPVPRALTLRVHGVDFGDLIELLDFFAVFGPLLKLERWYPEGLQLEDVVNVLSNVSTDNRFTVMINALLSVVFELEGEGKIPVTVVETNCLPFLTYVDGKGESDKEMDSERGAGESGKGRGKRGSLAPSWSMMYLNTPFKNLPRTDQTISEVLRLYLVSASFDEAVGCPRLDDPAFSFRRANRGAMGILAEKHISALNASARCDILLCLVRRIVTFEKVKLFVGECARRKSWTSSQTDAHQNLATGGDLPRNTTTNVAYRACEERGLVEPLGWDRFGRLYWIFPYASGLFVEDVDLARKFEDSCLEAPPDDGTDNREREGDAIRASAARVSSKAKPRCVWSYFSTGKAVDALIASLDTNDERERELRRSLIARRNVICRALKQPSVSETLSVRVNAEPEDMEDVLDRCFRAALLRLEDRLYAAWFGGFQTQNGSPWRDYLERGIDDPASAQYCDLAGNPGQRISRLASLLSELERSIRIKRLQPPLGLTEAVKSAWEPSSGDMFLDRGAALTRWELSLGNVKSYAGLLLHLHVLEKSVLWEERPWSVACGTCEESCLPEATVQCESCDLFYHTSCAVPTPKGKPVESWLCSGCVDRYMLSPPPPVKSADKKCSLHASSRAKQEVSRPAACAKQRASRSALRNQEARRKRYVEDMSYGEEDDEVDGNNNMSPIRPHVARPRREVPEDVDYEEAQLSADESDHNGDDDSDYENEGSSNSEESSDESDDGISRRVTRSAKTKTKVSVKKGSNGRVTRASVAARTQCSSTRSASPIRRRAAVAASEKIQQTAAKKSQKVRVEDTDDEDDEDDDDGGSDWSLNSHDWEAEQNRRVTRSCRRASPASSGSSRTGRSNFSVDFTFDFVALTDLLSQLTKHVDAWPFLRPVTKKVAPTYHRIIKNPMDFGTIHQRLSQTEYTRNNEFISDVLLVFSNCRRFNHKYTDYYACADRLERFFKQKVNEAGLGRCMPDTEEAEDGFTD